MTCQPLRSLEGVRVSRGLRQLDNIIDALWVVIIHKSLAALSVQRTEGAAEGRLSQNTTFDGLEAQDLNPQQDRGGGLHVCVGDDSLTNLLSLLSTRISCAGTCRICPASTAFCQPEALCQRTSHRHRTSLGSQRFAHRAATWDFNCFTTTHTDGVVHSTAAASFGQARCLCDSGSKGATARARPFSRSDVHVQRGGPSIGKIEHRGHFDDQFHHVPNQGFVMIHHNHTSRSFQNRQVFAVECAV